MRSEVQDPILHILICRSTPADRRIVCIANPAGPDFSNLIGVTSELSARVSVDLILVLLQLSGVAYSAVGSWLWRSHYLFQILFHPPRWEFTDFSYSPTSCGLRAVNSHLPWDFSAGTRAERWLCIFFSKVKPSWMLEFNPARAASGWFQFSENRYQIQNPLEIDQNHASSTTLAQKRGARMRQRQEDEKERTPKWERKTGEQEYERVSKNERGKVSD